MGAWAPSLLIRHFAKNPAQVGIQLGFLLTAGFGGGVLLGGWLADRAGSRGGWPYKLGVCLAASALIVPLSGPSAVTAASEHLFGGHAGLGPALTLTVASGYGLAAATLIASLLLLKAKRS